MNAIDPRANQTGIVLTPEQQKVFDAQGMHQRRERGMHGHGGMHHGSKGAPAPSAS